MSCQLPPLQLLLPLTIHIPNFEPLNHFPGSHISDIILPPLSAGGMSTTLTPSTDNQLVSPSLSVASGIAESQSQSLYELDDIKTEYHPLSKRDTIIHHFHEDGLEDDHPQVPTASFRTLRDFNTAAFTLDATLNNTQIDQLINLIGNVSDEHGGGKLTIHDHKEMDELWEDAVYMFPKFIKETVSAKYGKYHNSHRNFSMVTDYVSRPHFQKELSTFGTVKGYPVIAHIANLHIHAHNGDGPGCGCMIGWLPVIEEKSAESGKPKWIALKGEVYHKAIALICQSIKPWSCNAFWSIQNSNAYLAVSFDVLHTFDGGLFGHHIFQQILKHVQSRDAKSTLDNQAAAMLQWQNFHHFATLTTITFNDESKFEDISKILLFVAHNILTKDADPLGYLLLKCLHAYIDLRLYARMEVHTSETITAGEQLVIELGELLQYSDEAEGTELEKSFNFPKAHLFEHLFADIKLKGATRNYNTKPNEKIHGELKNVYQWRTNFQDVAPQDFLNNNLQARGQQYIHLDQYTTITEFQLLHVHYESMVNWCQVTDLLRCNPDFYNHPRYDHVIIQSDMATQLGNVIIAKLAFIFRTKFNGKTYDLALVCPLDKCVWQTKKDKDLWFTRLKPQTQKEGCFIFLQSIIRGALVVEDFDVDDEYLLIDTIDADMFLHVLGWLD
ncbi:hypothetical protein BDN71DRAFT_1555900 [Pleurotus eryngii]|uniref:Uncharacterized protein n=1 Tax=Pleurotus eryngii TaxID=5323 RepID=A0A9P6A7P2_PLEER|nr:hypothetical protein BDN71DRAFT_1555900 [Pleurotus eryngii]